MLDVLYTTWFVPIPTLLTGLVLLRRMRQMREEVTARALIPAHIEREEIALNTIANKK